MTWVGSSRFADVALGLASLAACDGCGTVGAMVHRHGWRYWEIPTPNTIRTIQHHCRDCVAANELLAAGLVYKKKTTEAVTYAEWANPFPKVQE